MEGTLDELIADGLVEEVEPDADGERRYRLTELGIAKAESYIQTPEGALFYGRLHEGREQ